MRAKIAALFGILTALAAGVALNQGQCQKLADALDALEDYPDVQQALVKEYGMACGDAVIRARSKCVHLPNGFTCRNGFLYGPGEGGIKPCVDPGDTEMCQAHQGDLDSLDVSRERLLDILKKKEVRAP